MLHEALRKGLGSPVGWVQAQAHRLPFADAVFDGVVCANSFHYFREPAAALREMGRVLRPERDLVLVDWCDDYLSCKLCSHWLHWTDPAFHHTYTLDECRALIRTAGLDVVHARRFRVGWLWGLMTLVCRRAPALPLPGSQGARE